MNHNDNHNTLSRKRAKRREDAALSDLLASLMDYTPTIPDELVEHCFAKSGSQCPDARLIRLVAVATQKFVADVASDALQHCKARQAAVVKDQREKQQNDKRLILSMDDLSQSFREYLQRWAIIKKQFGNLNLEGTSTASQLSEAQLETRSALFSALDMPNKTLTAGFTNNPGLTTACSNSALISWLRQGRIASVQTQNQPQQGPSTSVSDKNQPQPGPTTSVPTTALPAQTEGSSTSVSANNQPQKGPITALPSQNLSREGTVASVQVPNQSQQGPVTTKTLPQASSAAGQIKKPAVKSLSILDATAVATGARIAGEREAKSLLKAAQSKNAIRIMTSGASSVKHVMPRVTSSQSEVHSNVQHVDLTTEPVSSPVATSSTLHPGSSNAVTSSPTVEGPVNEEEPEAAGEDKGSVSDSLPRETIPENRACVPQNDTGEAVDKNKPAVSNQESDLKNHEGEIRVSMSDSLHKEPVQENGACMPQNEPVEKDPLVLSFEGQELLYEAAEEGSVTSLLELIQRDRLLLDRVLVNYTTETPLHVAAMLGHTDFVKEIIHRKPEFTRELDSRNSSSLHLASAKGNPLHLAAMKGQIDVLKELVQARPDAARITMAWGETIFHLCVKYGQFESLKLLIEVMDDHEVVNAKDDYGMTILHLAVSYKQIETVKFLLFTSSIEVNAVNANGFTAMDVLAQSRRGLKDFDIAESLRDAGALRAAEISHPGPGIGGKRDSLMVVAILIATMAFQAGLTPPGGLWQDDPAPALAPGGNSQGNNETEEYTNFDNQIQSKLNPLLPNGRRNSNEIGIGEFLQHDEAASSPFPRGISSPIMEELTTISTRNLSVDPNQQIWRSHSLIRIRRKKQSKKKHNSWLERKRTALMVVASLIATMAFESGVNPPKGMLQEVNKVPYKKTSEFIKYNTMGFLASLTVILLLIGGLPLRSKFIVWILTVIMWIAIASMVLAYSIALHILLASYGWKNYPKTQIAVTSLFWYGVLAFLLLSHAIRLAFKVAKYARKSCRRSSPFALT
ncbi:hypothetical protein CCACVL1_20866 [Corchorus capsularis]|uniref:PGG domain-containing protein n=1 Tax=Corchorus capsularis TaxID=210143 RepID=A0A1R3H9S4_COCAP|nr:hypothetical protein CCACVL1_20866 [Corchorus capsularis]